MRRLVDSPLSAIRTARQFLFHAWMLHDAIQRGAITPAMFANEFVIGSTKLVRPPADRTPQALEGWAWNTVLAAMAIGAMAADQALDATFGTPPRERTPRTDTSVAIRVTSSRSARSPSARRRARWGNPVRGGLADGLAQGEGK
jgi:hypothetical protein